MGQEPSENPRLRTFGVLRNAGIGLALTVALGGIALALAFPTPDSAGQVHRFWPLAFAGFPILGALVLWRRPEHRIGQLLLAIGFIFRQRSTADSTEHASTPSERLLRLVIGCRVLST